MPGTHGDRDGRSPAVAIGPDSAAATRVRRRHRPRARGRGAGRAVRAREPNGRGTGQRALDSPSARPRTGVRQHAGRGYGRAAPRAAIRRAGLRGCGRYCDGGATSHCGFSSNSRTRYPHVRPSGPSTARHIAHRLRRPSSSGISQQPCPHSSRATAASGADNRASRTRASRACHSESSPAFGSRCVGQSAMRSA